MNLKEKIIAAYNSLEEAISPDSNIVKIKEQAIKLFQEKGFPNRKDEDWKYTSLKSVLKTDFCVVPTENNNVKFEEIKDLFVETNSYKIVLVDGYFDENLSDNTSGNLIISSMQEAVSNNYNDIKEYFAKIAPSDKSMIALNTIGHADGFYINIANNTILDKPIQIIHIATGISGDTLLQDRNLVIVGKNVEAKVIEKRHSLTENKILFNSVTEISVGENSHFYHYKIQNDKNNTILLDSTFVAQNKYSSAYVDTFSFSGSLVRNNLEFYLNQEESTANMNGISLLNNNQHVDNFTFVDHKVSNCLSNELYKGIYDDSSKGVFTGKIMIRKDAQNTVGNQQNNNLLLSEKAQINAKPQLEIYADDVKASHGCTIGQLDKEALFFMRSRGIGVNEAKAMLMYAFANEALEHVKIDELKSYINKIIANKLGVNIDFDLE